MYVENDNAWIIHERVRSSLLGPAPGNTGSLWDRNHSMALALSASMPTGILAVNALRVRLHNLIGRRAFPGIRRNVHTTVVNFDTFNRPWPSNYMYVGHGPLGSAQNASPWGCPYMASSSFSCTSTSSFMDYGRNRADLYQWLLPLVNKNLICHCNTRCHAHDLLVLLDSLFPPIQQLVDAQSVPTVESRQVNADGHDDSSGSVVLSPKAGGCFAVVPDIWIEVASNMRISGTGLFWEFSSNETSFTEYYAQEGWCCAPLISDSVHSAFDLGNPQVLAIVLGLILEGRVTLVLFNVSSEDIDICSITDSYLKVATAMIRTGGHISMIWSGRFDGDEATSQFKFSNLFSFETTVKLCWYGAPSCTEV